MSKEIEYWRKEVENLKSQLQEKNEDLDSLKRSYDFTYENLTHLRDKLENCPVSGEVVVKLKGIYHTFFKAKINHPDYFDETDRQVEGQRKEVVNRDPLTNGGEIHYEDKVTGEKVLVKGITKYDVLEIKYKAECEENTRLLQRVAEAERQFMELRNNLKQQKSENEVLHRKVKDLCHKLCQARRESDKLAEKLKDKQILDPVFAHKYWAQQIALKSEIGEVFECEFNDGLALETGYYLRISKKSYELAKEGRLPLHAASLWKRSDK